jgi:hypothetical protein
MANVSAVIKCTITDSTSTEGIELYDNNEWKSPAGGWLPVQSGKWIQNSSSGIVLFSEDKIKIALLKGLLFDTATVNNNGDALYDYNGGAGKWQITATT